MKIIFSAKCLSYKTVGHPESPERISETVKLLKKENCEIIEPRPCNQKDILIVHSQDLFDKVKRGDFFDLDTPDIKGIFDYAALSAGAAIMAAKLAIKKEKAFSLMRPPGHHATRESLGGFCYFNNIAIAIRKILKDTKNKIKKAAILDIDVHHGNGTEDIFLGDEHVLYLSLHQVPLYPGTGQISQDNCLNYPLAAFTKEVQYLEILQSALEKIVEFKPDIVGVSCGFDTYKDDPLASINLEINSYQKIAQIINQLNKPTFYVLEGGYSERLPDCIRGFLKGIK